MKKRFVVFGAILAVLTASQASATVLTHDPTTFIAIVEQVYNSYEQIIGMYNQIKTQAEQYQAQLKSLKDIKSRIAETASTDVSKLKNAFKDLNSFENLTDLQKVEASRYALKSLVRDMESYDQELQDAVTKVFTRSVYSANGTKYNLGSLMGITSDGQLAVEALDDLGAWFAENESELVRKWRGDTTKSERIKLYDSWGISSGVQALNELYREDTLSKVQAAIGENDTENIHEDTLQEHKELYAINLASELSSEDASQIGVNEAQVQATIKNAEISLRQLEVQRKKLALDASKEQREEINRQIAEQKELKKRAEKQLKMYRTFAREQKRSYNAFN